MRQARRSITAQYQSGRRGPRRRSRVGQTQRQAHRQAVLGREGETTSQPVGRLSVGRRAVESDRREAPFASYWRLERA